MCMWMMMKVVNHSGGQGTLWLDSQNNHVFWRKVRYALHDFCVLLLSWLVLQKRGLLSANQLASLLCSLHHCRNLYRPLGTAKFHDFVFAERLLPWKVIDFSKDACSDQWELPISGVRCSEATSYIWVVTVSDWSGHISALHRQWLTEVDPWQPYKSSSALLL